MIINMKLKTLLAFFVILFFNITLFAQESYTLTGAVIDANDNYPIPGASVFVTNTGKGVVTDYDGNYSIVVQKGNVVQFSFIGYVTQSITITDQKKLDVVLSEDTKILDEVVVIGYGTQRKSHTTGSISKVVNDDLDQIAVSRIDDALVGQVSGVNIQATEGEAGSAPTINIRGVGSMSGDSAPLVVVDGVIVDSDFLGSMNMNTVESFEILKDAASAAIYGSKGSNGIIMITTKSGKEGKTKFNYSGYIGHKNARESDAYTFSLAETAAAEFAALGYNSDRTLSKLRIGIDRSWQDVIFDNGLIQNHSLSFRGGSKATKFSASLNYMHDEGVLLTDDFKKYGLKLKLDTKVNDRLTLGTSISPSFTDRRRFDGSTHDIMRQTVWLPVYLDENTIEQINRYRYPDAKIGDYATQYMFDGYDVETGEYRPSGGTSISTTSNANPAAKVQERERTDEKMKVYGNIYGNYNFTKALSFRTALSGSYQDTKRSRWEGVKSHRNGASAARMNEKSERNIYLIWDNFLTYNLDVKKHEGSVLIGTSGEQRNSFYSSMTGTGYTSDAVKQISNAAEIIGGDGFEWEKTGLSYVARVNYAYDNKYLGSFSFRRDGSSIFGKDFKYGNFPAVSIGWNIANEDFLIENDVVNSLKLRASYGVTGNDRLNVGSIDPDATSASGMSTGSMLVDYYPSLALLAATTAIIDGVVTPGFNPANIANPELKWERSIEINPGLDFGLFNNAITGSIDWYRKTSDQLLLNNPISATTGFNHALVNLGEVRNQGWEFELRTRNISNRNFRWSSTVIATMNKNTLVDFADSNGQITIIDEKRASEWINLEGKPISTFYGWVVDKEIPLEYISNPYHPVGGQAQDVYVKDLNGDGIIDDEDKAPLGDPYPDLVWSFINEFKIKDFDFSFMFQGSHGAMVRNMGDQYMFNHFNSAQDFDPKITPDQHLIKEKIFTNHIVQDASYIALRNVNIGYNLPREISKKLGVDGLRVYASGQNLMYKTASDYTGWNPEGLDKTTPTSMGYQRGGSPIFSTISFGVNIDF